MLDKDYLIKGEMYQYNLGWLIKELMSFKQDLATAIDLKTIKYADPIQWDITTQYPANTVVVNPKSGTAYMSKVPVPAGVELTNTNYWVVVFNYQDIYNKIMDGVAFNDRDQDYATKDLLVNDLVWYAGDLYRVTRAIQTGSKYIPGTNLIKTTIESLLARYYGRDRTAQVSNDTVNVSGDYTLVAGDIAETASNLTLHSTKDMLLDADGKLTEQITGSREIDVDGSDSTHVNGASTLNIGGLRTEVYAGDKTVGVTGAYTGKFGSASFETGAPSWKVKFPDKTVDLYDIGKNSFIDVKKQYGAKGDGVTSDSTAIQKAVNENLGRTIYFPAGVYLISSTIVLPDNTYLVGDGMSSTELKMANGLNGRVIKNDKYDENAGKDTHTVGNVNITIANMRINGNYHEVYNDNSSAVNNTSGIGISLYGGGLRLDHIYVYNCATNGLLTEWNSYTSGGNNDVNGESLFNYVVCKWNGQNGWIYKGPHDSLLANCIIASNGRSNHDTYANMEIGEKGNLRIVNCHFYSDYGVPKVAISLLLDKEAYQCSITNCHIEGGASQSLAIYNGFNQINNCFIYASFGDADVLIGNDHQYFSNCMFGGPATGEGTTSKTWVGAFKFLTGKGRNISVSNGILNNTPLFVNPPTITSISTWDVRGYNATNIINNKCANFAIPGVNDTDIITVQGDFGEQDEFYYKSNNFDHTLSGIPLISGFETVHIDTQGKTVDMYNLVGIAWGQAGTVRLPSPKKSQIGIYVIRADGEITLTCRDGGTINSKNSMTITGPTNLILLGEEGNWSTGIADV